MRYREWYRHSKIKTAAWANQKEHYWGVWVWKLFITKGQISGTKYRCVVCTYFFPPQSTIDLKTFLLKEIFQSHITFCHQKCPNFQYQYAHLCWKRSKHTFWLHNIYLEYPVRSIRQWLYHKVTTYNTSFKTPGFVETLSIVKVWSDVGMYNKAASAKK